MLGECFTFPVLHLPVRLLGAVSGHLWAEGAALAAVAGQSPEVP